MRLITTFSTKKDNFLPAKEILGIRIHVVSLEKALSLVENWVNSNKKYQIVTPNPEQLVLAQNNQVFRQVLNRADLAIPDGVGLVWPAQLYLPPDQRP